MDKRKETDLEAIASLIIEHEYPSEYVRKTMQQELMCSCSCHVMLGGRVMITTKTSCDHCRLFG